MERKRRRGKGGEEKKARLTLISGIQKWSLVALVAGMHAFAVQELFQPLERGLIVGADGACLWRWHNGSGGCGSRVWRNRGIVGS